MSLINIFITFVFIIPLNADQGITPFSPPIVSSECMNLGLCDTVENYPIELARKLIKELKDKNALIADDPIISTTQKPRLSYEAWLGQRVFGRQHHHHYHHHKYAFHVAPTYMETYFSSIEEDMEIPLCDSTVLYQHPKVAENTNNSWKFILNDDDQPIQTFRLERCNSSRSTCSGKINFMPNYEGVCVQKWILREMYYIHDDGTSRQDYFKIPSCCSCGLLHTKK